MPKRKPARKRASKRSKSRLLFGYPLVLFFLLCSGIYLVHATFQAAADNINVTAAIPGPPVTAAPAITTPADGTHFTAVPITVSGSCPTNAAYVEIFRNSVMSGTAICNAGNFTLQSDLFPGRNDLTAQGFNITDDPGPISTAITVYYDVPTPPPSTTPGQTGQGGSGQTGSGQPSSGNPLVLKTAFVYKGYFTGQEVDWPLEISGGDPPYAFNIDWGDGSNSVISRKDAGQFTIKHTYKKAGGYKGSYPITVQASDASNNYAYLQFFVIVTDKTTQPIGSIYSKPPPTLGSLRHWLWVAWPVYSSIFLMALTYKLGEREELIILKKRGWLKR